MARKVCAMCEYFGFLSHVRNIGLCSYRKQYVYGIGRKCKNYVPLTEQPEGE